MPYLLFFGLIAGQLFKLPLSNLSGITLLDLTLIVFVAFSLVKYGLKIKQIPLWFKAGIAFAGFGLVSLLFSPLNLSLSEKFISLSYLIRFLLFLTAGLLINWNYFGLKKNTLKLLFYSGITLTLLGIGQLIFFPNLQFLASYGWDPHFFRNVSTFLDPNFAGAFFGLALIILYLTKLDPKNDLKISNKYFYLLFSLLFISLLTTFSRGSYLLFGTSFLAISALTKSLKTFLLTIILSVTLLLGFNIYLQLVATPQKVDRTKSAEQRIGTWQQGLIIFEKNPILGVGFNSYRFALEHYQLGSPEQINSHGGSTNDSSLLYVLATTGLVGFFAYLFFLFTIFKTGWLNFKSNNIWGLAVITGLIGLLAQSFFANTLFYPPLLGWLIFSTAQLSDNKS